MYLPVGVLLAAFLSSLSARYSLMHCLSWPTQMLLLEAILSLPSKGRMHPEAGQFTQILQGKKKIKVKRKKKLFWKLHLLISTAAWCTVSSSEPWLRIWMTGNFWFRKKQSLQSRGQERTWMFQSLQHCRGSLSSNISRPWCNIPPLFLLTLWGWWYVLFEQN